MWWAIRQLTVPMNYLRIRHGDDLFHSKAVYDFVLPAALSLATLGVFAALGTKISIFSNSELIKRVMDLLALMIAFYMAALAAVSTFDRKGIDAPLPDEDALLKKRQPDGRFADVALSYRQFISYCFGYLSFLSLCLYMFMIITSFVWEDIVKIFDTSSVLKSAFDYVVQPSIFLFTFFFIWQLMITSLLGIYFLTERIQTLNNID
jgi:hypothetical protein